MELVIYPLMRITYIITRADQYGGAQVHVRDLSAWLANRGHTVSVIAGTTGVLSQQLVKNGIGFKLATAMRRTINPFNDLIAFLQIRRYLKDLDPDIVSCHSSKAGWLGRLAAWSLGIPCIFTAHGWAFTDGIPGWKKFVYTQLERISALFCNHIITVSRFDKFLALKKHVKAAAKMTVIHNGKPYRPVVKNKPDNDIVQLCMVARFSPQKDHITLLNALGHLKDRNWHLNLIGDGDDTDIRALSKSLEIGDKITFHGERNDVPDFLETQDIYLLISNWEGFPRSIIEAMRTGIPVISTRTAGSPEAIDNFKTGFIVPQKNAHALSRALSLLIADKTRRLGMGAMGRQRYERYFTFERMAWKTFSVYETVLGLTPSKHLVKQELVRAVPLRELSRHS